MSIERFEVANDRPATEDVTAIHFDLRMDSAPTKHRPEATSLTQPLAPLIEWLRKEVPDLNIHIASSFGIAIITADNPNIDDIKPPHDFDFAVSPEHLDALETIVSRINTDDFTYVPHSSELITAEASLVDGVRSRVLRFRMRLNRGAGSIYEVEIFDNLQLPFIQALLPDDKIAKISQVPTVQAHGLTIWHPRLIKAFYEKLMAFELRCGQKLEKNSQRQHIIAAAEKACLYF